MNEAAARIKINKLLEAAGWRFFDADGGPANIRLEANVKTKASDLDALGENFEKTSSGWIDFLLLDDKGFPLIVLEAKREDLSPLTGKEQARKYARSQNCRFVILSNGNLHYFWDLQRGNPHLITVFPTPDSVEGYCRVEPDSQRLIAETVRDDYIVLTQRPGYESEAAWRNEAERPAFEQAHKLRFLRAYQLRAVHALQRAVQDGNDRFLLEMATGTGKTLTAAAVVKLFLRTGNARRVLFLVDRLELEEQARKVLDALLASDFQTVVYKENRDDWNRAEIVVSTVQSLLFNNKYQRLFSPTDFDLVISDEAHRSIGGNARAVFEYFVGYKLGLTATPRDYLRGFEALGPGAHDSREAERRLLLDTYRTFGCESSQPTFRYSLLDGVRDGYLISPTVVDARTDVSTQAPLGARASWSSFADDRRCRRRRRGRTSSATSRGDSLRAPPTSCSARRSSKTPCAIRSAARLASQSSFGVSQVHAAKLTQILNEIADRMFPGRYQSDFAVQVTSQIADAQQFAINFANNNLLGSGNVFPAYRTSKARVCVTVGMMTTGYDCTDILNLGLFRPIFSPTDFIQIKGRGTRIHDFRDELHDDALKDGIRAAGEDCLQALRLLRQLRVLRGGLQLRRGHRAASSWDSITRGWTMAMAADPVVRIDGVYQYLGPDVISHGQGRDHRPPGHEDRPDVLRSVRRNGPRR